MLDGELIGANLPTTCPSLSTKKLVKFHFMHSPNRPPFSDFRNLYNGAALLPFTSTCLTTLGLFILKRCLSGSMLTNRRKQGRFFIGYTLPKIGYSALKRVQASSAICLLVPGSCPPNWLHGKANISNPNQPEQKTANINGTCRENKVLGYWLSCWEQVMPTLELQTC